MPSAGCYDLPSDDDVEIIISSESDDVTVRYIDDNGTDSCK
jgi:hypothetical protein